MEDICSLTHYLVVSEPPYCKNRLKPVRNACQKRWNSLIVRLKIPQQCLYSIFCCKNHFEIRNALKMLQGFCCAALAGSRIIKRFGLHGSLKVVVELGNTDLCLQETGLIL